MRFLYAIFFILVTQATVIARETEVVPISVVINSKALEIQKKFERAIPENTPVIYTFVPRGLIVSIHEEVFFVDENTDINLKGVRVLNSIIGVLKSIDNDCTVECHTEGHFNPCAKYKSNWEISMARANSITDYVVYCGKIPSHRVFPLGFGEWMPFKENVSTATKGFDKRIDFVIFDYEYER